MFKTYSPEYARKSRRPLYVFLASIPLTLLIVYIAIAPFWTVWDMARAAQNKDGERFASYIDFPQFKENLKAELNASLAANMANNKEMQNNPFSGLGMLLGPTIINNLVDGFVTPQGIERMMSGQLVPQMDSGQPAKLRGNFLDGNVAYEMAYTGVNEFRIAITTEPGLKPTVLIFRRHNLIAWRLVGIKLPS